MEFITLLDWICTAVFAITGALAAVEKRMDLGGALLLAFITGTGGGTLRDLLLDREVFWFASHTPIYLCAAAAIVTFFATRSVSKLKRAILWIDAIGLALFSTAGATIALNAGADPVICVLMGACSATGGGIIREVVRNEIPIVLQRDIYITAALAGATVLVLLDRAGLDLRLANLLGAAVAFALRAAGIAFNLSLPAPKPLTPER
jgi:uncharacterized membrane protein YeiH